MSLKLFFHPHHRFHYRHPTPMFLPPPFTRVPEMNTRDIDDDGMVHADRTTLEDIRQREFHAFGLSAPPTLQRADFEVCAHDCLAEGGSGEVGVVAKLSHTHTHSLSLSLSFSLSLFLSLSLVSCFFAFLLFLASWTRPSKGAWVSAERCSVPFASRANRCLQASSSLQGRAWQRLRCQSTCASWHLQAQTASLCRIELLLRSDKPFRRSQGR